jgi:hypothetical protein
MLGILNAIVEHKKRIENNIDQLSQDDIKELNLYEQLAALEKAESAMRSAVKEEINAKKLYK